MTQHEQLEFKIDRKLMLNAHGNSNWRAEMAKIKKLRHQGKEYGEQVREQRPIFFDHFSIQVTIKPPTRRKLDPPNYYPTVKPIIDGLTDAGWWQDDNFAYMVETSFRYGGLAGLKLPDGKNDNNTFRVILDIYEVHDTSSFITIPEFFS